jgi:hypothetical protein
MPDRETGEPRPPRAPIARPSKEQRKPWHPKKVPQPPDGQGPPLEWDYGNAREKRWTFGVAIVLITAFLTLRGALSSDSSTFGWVQHWQVWAVLIAGGLLMSLGKSQDISAGADWFMRHKAFVKTYELVSVKMDKDWGHGEVTLQDRSGNEAKVSLMLLKQPLWDLVYNGILHSVAAGADVDRMVVQRLRLYDALAIREQNQSKPE